MKNIFALFAALTVISVCYADESPVFDSKLIQNKKPCFSQESSKNSDLVSRDHAESEEGVQENPESNSQKNLNLDIACIFFTYEVDGLVIDGFIAMPKTYTKPLSPVIYNRGGNRDYGRLTASATFKTIVPLAENGFFVIGSQYRGSRNHDRKSHDEFGGKDLNDVMALLDIIDDLKFVRKGNVGLVGGSRGGMMALMLAKKSDRFKPIVLLSTPTDLLADVSSKYGKGMEKNVYSQLIPKYNTNKADVLMERSAIYWVEKLSPKTPILIIHARDDDRVDAKYSLAFAQKLQELSHPYKLVIFEDGGHSLQGQSFINDVNKWLHKFLD